MIIPKSSKRRKNGKIPKSHKITIENTERMYWNSINDVARTLPRIINVANKD